MRVLIACEESQVVCKAFRARGHDDVTYHLSGGWDLMIAHPPCTFLSTVANRWYTDAHLNSVLSFEKERRLKSRKLAIEFVLMLLSAPIEKIAVENPVGVLSSQIRKPNQLIHPYYFGDPHQKQTCLWLKNLPELQYEKAEKPEPVYYLRSNGKPITFVESLGRHPQRAKLRSKTFPGIAKAMAEQWG